jgi:hypothetical protein
MFSLICPLRRLEVCEPPRSLFRWISPRIGRRADEGAHRYAVAELDELHRDEPIDDPRQLARNPAALNLGLPFAVVEFVGDPFEDRPAGDEHGGHSNDRPGWTANAIPNRWFSGNFSLALTP